MKRPGVNDGKLQMKCVTPHNQNRYKQLLQGLSVREYSPIDDVALKVLNIPGQLEIHY